MVRFLGSVRLFGRDLEFPLYNSNKIFMVQRKILCLLDNMVMIWVKNTASCDYLMKTCGKWIVSLLIFYGFALKN